jgi:DNA-binding LacI/PurR family transcriptional regulator
MTTGRVTLRDVARAAGVSVTTVSDALSGRGRLPAATRTRVAEVAAGLGYSANPNARNLRLGRTGAIGLYFPARTIHLEYYLDLAMGAAEEALSHDLALTLIPAGDGRRPAPHVDGVVVSDPVVGDPMLQRFAAQGVPVVTIERDLTDAEHAGRVESDHRTATAALLDHLADRGARRIALLCPGDETAFGHDIRRAYLAWCGRHERRPVMRDVAFACLPEDVSRAVADVLAGPDAPDAIVSVPDGGATSALQAALLRGLRVPEDLLVASYVDSPSLRGSATPVTAVDIAPRAAGRTAARLLADLLTGRAPRGTVEVLPTRLVVRASTSPGQVAAGSSP